MYNAELVLVPADLGDEGFTTTDLRIHGCRLRYLGRLDLMLSHRIDKSSIPFVENCLPVLIVSTIECNE
jgi:hypothetical protein